MDTFSAMANRSNRQENCNLKQPVLSALETILHDNPYAVAYQNAAEALNAELSSQVEVSLRFTDFVPMNSRTSNKPTAEEIAGLFSSVDGEPPGFRHVVSHYKQGGPKLLSVLSPHCDPMLYPLLFPYGEPGWDPKMKHNGQRKQQIRQRMTQLQFISYRLAVRRDFSHILQGKKLFQQYVVDAYIRVEGERLNFFRKQQGKLRVEQYKGLQDFVIKRSELDKATPGKIVILPSNFEGSSRNKDQRFQDAMSIVRTCGRPDLFITFTCNPNWSEITSALGPNETASDRPDLVARVFRSKLDEFKNDILKNHVLGVVVAHVYVIEFQKRGLPHCHLLCILDKDSKIKDPSDIDRLVSAEIPDKEKHPRLYNIVMSSMVHGPCGSRNLNSQCMKDGKCTKKYPKDFNEETVQNCNGYPLYRRRNNGVTAQKGVHQVDNRDIVPYSPFLSLKYDAHINVEICCSIRSVKYLFKYIYKGYDSASIEFINADGDKCMMYDEITSYINMRYLSPPEAIWRLHENVMHEQSHTVIRLAVHDEECQNVYFQEGEEEKALESSISKETTLTAWFELNKKDGNARQLLYSEIPEYYRFDGKKWRLRMQKKKKKIGRMYGVSPNDTDRFYLRMLLLHVKGAKSFEDLKTYNETTYTTFKEAVVARGLLQDDSEWLNCLKELENISMPKQLMETFAYICCFCEPSSPVDLWTAFKESMMEGYSTEDEILKENKVLLELQKIFQINGFSCEKLGLPTPDIDIIPECQNFDAAAAEKLGTELFNKLNDEQRQVVTTVLDAISGKTPNKLFFLEAPGGCGKTFVYNCIQNIVRGRNLIALSAAFTGIAALLLPDGTTLHKLCGFPVPLTNTSVSNIKPNSEKAALLRKAAIICIDEASMIPAAAINCMDRLLRDIMKTEDPALNDVPMGGKVILFGGDFRQVLPVVPHGSRAQIVESCMQNSIIWNELKILHLKTNMRAHLNERQFSEWLLEIGNGTTESNSEKIMVSIPKEMICDKEKIVTEIFGEKLSEENIENYLQCAIVTPLNDSCFELNNIIINNLLQGEAKEYVSVDSILSEDPAENLNVPLEYINSLTPSGMPPHKLVLKKGAIVVLIRNMNIGSGLVNGVRMIVRGMQERSLKLEVITGTGKGNIIFLPRIKLISTDANMPFSISRIQFPVRVSFVMTLNKAQGQTFDKIGIYLPKPVFCHGQLYVGFSRVRCAAAVKIYFEAENEDEQENRKEEEKNKEDDEQENQEEEEEKNEDEVIISIPKTRNIVYREVLLNP